MKNFSRIIIAAFILFLPITAFASPGDLIFTSTGITFSGSRFIEGQNVLIYASAYSNQNVDLRGSIRFFDDGRQIGNSQPISVVDGKIDNVFVEWTPQAPGDHKIKAQIIPFGRDDDNNINNNTIETTVRVLYDSDRDSVPNIEDPDDDNDGVSDTIEIERGSDPYNRNSIPSETAASNSNGTATTITSASSYNSNPTQTVSQNSSAAQSETGQNQTESNSSNSSSSGGNTNSQPRGDIIPSGGGILNNQTPAANGTAAPADATKKIIVIPEDENTTIILAPRESIQFETVVSTRRPAITPSTEWTIDGRKQTGRTIRPSFNTTGFHEVIVRMPNDENKVVEKRFTVFVIQPFLLWSSIFLLFLILILAIFWTFSYSKRRRGRFGDVHAALDMVLKWLPDSKKRKK